MQGSEQVLAKKSEKCVMPSPRRDVHGSFKELRRIWFIVGGGGFGGPPPENFWISGPQMEYSKAFLGQSTPIPIPLPPKKFSSDLH